MMASDSDHRSKKNTPSGEAFFSKSKIVVAFHPNPVSSSYLHADRHQGGGCSLEQNTATSGSLDPKGGYYPEEEEGCLDYACPARMDGRVSPERNSEENYDGGHGALERYAGKLTQYM